MNKKQLIVAWGLVAYIVGGLIVVIFNLQTSIEILRSRLNLFIPILQVYIPLLILGIQIIYVLREVSPPGQ